MTLLQERQKQQHHHHHKRPAPCTITIVHTAPPLFVETTSQAEFRAVVQRLTAGGGSSSSNNSNSQTLQADHYNSPSSSQSEANFPKSPIIAASNRRRPRRHACSRSGVPRSGSNESLCDASNSAAAQDSAGCGGHDQSTVISDSKDDHYSTMYDAASPSCRKKVKQLPMSYPVHIYALGVQERGNTLGATSLPPLPSSLSFSSSSSSPPPPHPSSPLASPANDPPAVISHTIGQLTAISHDKYDHNNHDDADYYFPGTFYCDPPSLAPPLMDIIDEHQQRELLTTLHSSSTSTLYSSPISISRPSQLYHTTDHWDALNSWSFSMKDDDFLCV